MLKTLLKERRSVIKLRYKKKKKKHNKKIEQNKTP